MGVACWKRLKSYDFEAPVRGAAEVSFPCSIIRHETTYKSINRDDHDSNYLRSSNLSKFEFSLTMIRYHDRPNHTSPFCAGIFFFITFSSDHDQLKAFPHLSHTFPSCTEIGS